MSKGGSQKTEVKVPEWLEDAAKQAIARANQSANIGYMPYYGPDVAALNPTQIGAMRTTNQAARAFGMDTTPPMQGMPKPQTFRGGIQGYSSGPLFQQARQEFAQRHPRQHNLYNSFYGR